MTQVAQRKSDPARQDKYHQHPSDWVKSFSCAHLKILIVCRGPIRKEAMDVFEELGAEYGILLSEKDSVTYPHTLAPELRTLTDQRKVHRVPDYTGASGEERKARIAQIIQIARSNGYSHIFAGYGFMAEDAEFVEAIEKGGIGFVGPASHVHHAAGAKDQAKKLARSVGVSVTPGLDNITSITLLKKAGGNLDGLKKLAAENSLHADTKSSDPEEYAEALLEAGYRAGKGLITLAEIQEETRAQMETLLRDNPGRRFRLKYIGGGGGKGQRIVTKIEEVDTAVLEVLSESKAMGEADNRNFLIELNIENTRHNEIQLIGNGEWCVALGGRDCSLQMHEQKLVELSITDELFEHEIEQALKDGHNTFAEQLRLDRKTLQAMEEQSERFGKACRLNSASTFECIVSRDSFYFMEMNTRIQVEHRVTEMVYSLKFVNPANKSDTFVVESLVEAMALIAAHGSRLPKPLRTKRHTAGGEIRLNATNDALQPHAGGIIESWSSPVDREIRDDQGIGVRNPDTGWFIKYNLAGAYDSNIALIVSYGEGRRENLQSLSNILRQTELRGVDLHTNLNFHYGILNFCLGLHPMLKPDTKFVLPYLAGVGSVARELESIDLEEAWKEMRKKTQAALGAKTDEVFLPKLTLITRPLGMLKENAHAAAGWFILNRGRAFTLNNGKITWKRNRLRVLSDLYEYLHMEYDINFPPSQQIWEHDYELLRTGLKFYADLEKQAGIDSERSYFVGMQMVRDNSSTDFEKLDHSLTSGENPFGLPEPLFTKARNAHIAWQAGLGLLDMIVLLAENSGIFEFGIDEHLSPIVPEKFLDAGLQKEMSRYLAPPPAASGNEIVAMTGGMYYSRETPTSPQYLKEGAHFEAGQPIYIIEVMKMFNKIQAEFAGTVEKVLVHEEAGVVVRKGQPLFQVKPDEEIKIESLAERSERRKRKTLEMLRSV